MDRRDLPVYVIAGELDPVAGGSKWMADSIKFLEDMGYTNIKSKLYEGFRHEIFMDTGREVPFADVAGFIEETIDKEQDRLSAKQNEYQKQF